MRQEDACVAAHSTPPCLIVALSEGKTKRRYGKLKDVSMWLHLETNACYFSWSNSPLFLRRRKIERIV
jgi:hypothetical protein